MKPLRYLLILCGLTLCTSQLHAYETLYTTIDSIKYSYLDSEDGGTASVCGFVEGLTNAVIPETIQVEGYGTKRVTDFASYAFRDCTTLKSVVIPNTVGTLGTYSFYGCSSLTSINIPAAVTRIGSYAFWGCSSLASIHLPQYINKIEDCTFYGCSSLTSLTLPKYMTKIGNNAFQRCSSLTSLILPDKLIQIDSNAFNRCIGLTSISIPKSVTSMGNGVFSECANLSSVIIQNGLTVIPDYTFSKCTSLVSLDIPNSVTTIGYEAFSGCTSLTSIHIPNTVTSIGRSAFKSCTSLTTVNIPDGIIEIPYGLFRYCSSLTSVTIPEGVTTVGDYAFDLCTSLVSVNIPEGVTSIGEYSFATTALTSIIIPASLTEIKNNAFLYTYFTSVYISDGITNFNWEKFDGTSLVSLSIPCGINAVEIRNLFKNDATAHGMITIRGNSVFVKPIDGNYNIVYNVDAGMYDKYSRSSVWNKYLKQVISADMLNLTTVECTADSLQSNLFSQLGDNALYVANLKVKGSINGYDIMTLRNKTVHLLYLDLSEADVVANDGGYEYYPGCRMTEDNKFGDRSFYGTNLRRVVMPNTLKTIGKYSFADCGFLETVVLNQGLETIDENAFNNCRFLETADFKEGLETINMNAFRNCTRYVVKNLPKSLVTIGNEAFRYCKVASYLNIPDNVETIGEGAFRDCSGVDSIVVGKSVTDLKNFAFGGCPASYVSLDKARGLTRIGEYAFGSCKNLKTITFGRNDKLTVVAYRAFEYCSSLEEILLPFSVESIGAGAFRDCSSLKYIKIPSMTRTIGEGAFSGCDYIENIYTYTVEPTEINQNTFTCFLQATLNVPKTSALLYKYDTQWSQFVRVHEFEEPYDAFYLKGDLELTEDGGRLEGEPDADMYETSGFIVQGDDIQELNDVVLVHNGTDGATIIGASGDVTGSQVNLTAKSMKVNISVDGNRWYFFCFPFEVEQDSIECTTEHVFYEYDSQARANGNTGWVKVPDDFGFLSKDVGYIFQTNRSGILTIHVGSDYLTFTANNEKENLQTASSNNPADAHWNFIGNPYISYYDVQDLAQEYDAPIAIWNGRSYDVYKPGDDDYQLKPFEAFFVQKETGASYVEFLPENRMTYNRAAEVSSLRAARRAGMGTPINLDRQLVNISIMSQDSLTDRTRIVYSVNASMDYEIGVDAAKFQTDGVPQIYTLNGNTKYAINERSMGTDDIKLGYMAPKGGTYTLSVPRHDAEIEIYDNETRQTVDFTFGDYQFTTKAGTFNDRFVIHKTSGGVTAVENGFRLDGMTVTAFDGGIEIEGQFKGKVQIYSESGMLMAEPKQSGRVQLDGGVYIIKIGDRSIKLNI